MVRPPMPGDLIPAAYPYAVESLNIVEEAAQRREAARPAGQPQMQPDGHHLWRMLALAIEHVERIAQVGEEVIAGREAVDRRKFHVVVVQRVRHDQVRPAVD